MDLLPRQHFAAETMAERIQRLRKRIRGKNGLLSQGELAERVGVATSTLQKWEAGGNISGLNLLALARELGVTAEYLEGGDEGVYRDACEEIRKVMDRIERALPTISPTPSEVVDISLRDTEGGGGGPDDEQKEG